MSSRLPSRPAKLDQKLYNRSSKEPEKLFKAIIYGKNPDGRPYKLLCRLLEPYGIKLNQVDVQSSSYIMFFGEASFDSLIGVCREEWIWNVFSEEGYAQIMD